MQRYSAYKDSLFDWLGKIPAHWEEERAKWYFDKIDQRSETGEEELLSVSHITGVTPRSEKNVTMFQAESYEGHKLCQPGDLVINSMWAWMAALGVSRYSGIVSSAYGVYRPKSKELFNPQYLDYLMRIKGYAGEYLCRSKGIWSSRLLLNPEAFFNIPIVHPPLEEQDAIVAFLEEQTAVINQFLTNKRRLIDLLEEQKQVVINTAVTKGLDTAVPHKPSGIEWLGDIPAHWELKRLKHISPELSVGVVVTPSIYYDESGTVPFLFGSNISEGQISLKDVRKISEDSNEILSKSRLNAGDLVTVRVGYPGITAVIPSSLDGCNCASMMIIRQSSKFNSDWLCHVMNSPIIKEQIELVKYGAAQKQFNIGHAVNFIVPLPPKEEQQQILDSIKTKTAEINAAIERTQREIELIEEYRTTLIATAVTGKIDVRTIK